MTVDPEGVIQSTDNTVYVVTYLNGTSEEVVGVDTVRLHMMNPDLRDPATKTGHDLDEFQGGHWTAKREPVVE